MKMLAVGLRPKRDALALAVTLVTAMACAAPSLPVPPSGGGALTSAERPSRIKTIVFGVTTINPMAMTTVSSSAGGWLSAIEIHTNGLITSDETIRRPIG